jgi:hypothetical protein
MFYFNVIARFISKRKHIRYSNVIEMLQTKRIAYNVSYTFYKRYYFTLYFGLIHNVTH